MKKITLLLGSFGLMALSFWGACGPGTTPTSEPNKTPTQGTVSEKPAKPAWEMEWEKAVAEARKEGVLLVYTSQPADTIRRVGVPFKEKYGIAIDVLSARGPEITQRMLVERNGGLNLVDIIVAGGTNVMFEMRPQNLLGNIESILLLPEVLDPKAWIMGEVPYYDVQRSGIGMVARFSRYILRNTQLTREGDITSYRDVLDPKWQGKLVMNDPTVAGGGLGFATLLAQIWGEEEAKDFYRQLVKQEPALTRDQRMLIEGVARGKYLFSIGISNDVVSQFIDMGAPVATVRVKEPGKMGAGGGGIAIATRPAHPNAAKVFVNWILSREGHAHFVREYLIPGARVDAPVEGIPKLNFAEPGEKYLLDSEETSLLQTKVQKVTAEIFAPLLR